MKTIEATVSRPYIEIKFKEKNQRVRWEDLPVIRQVWESELDETIEWTKRLFQCVEIRWNYANKYQGHYVKGNQSRWSNDALKGA